MNTKKVNCPHCNGELETPASLDGQEVQCPLCHQNFVVNFEKTESEDREPSTDSSEISNINEKNSLRIVQRETNSSFAGKTFLLLTSIAGLVLLLSGNLLLFFCLTQQKESAKRFEQQINSLQINLDSLIVISDKSLKAIINFADRNQKAITNFADRNQKAIANFADRNQKAITNFTNKNQKVLKSIEQDFRVLTRPEAYEYRFINFDRDRRSLFSTELKILAQNRWEYVGVLTNNGINSKEILFRRKLQRK